MCVTFRHRFNPLAAILVAVVCAWTAGLSAADEPTAVQIEFFEKRVRPILVKHCYECHGAEAPSGRLRLDTRAGWERGGEAGPAVVPGDPSASLLIRAVSYDDAKLKMPPPDAGGKLADQQIADLVNWVRRGAADPRNDEAVETDIEVRGRTHWAFQPVRAPDVEEGVHPVDLLIDRKLSERGFVATEPADMRTLIRRATFDLHGLPPTARQLTTPRDQFPELVRQLLLSPRYGERWGRHWLDVARYSDAKDGVLMYGDARVRPFAYTYRDYVIRAFNNDKPFDQFIREQIAADQMGLAEDSPALAAMGLLTLGRMFDRNRHDVIDDQIDVVTRGFLGLTVSCSRCHDHKFDPVPTADYYSLYGVFASSIEPYDRPRIEEVSEQGKAFEKEFGDKLAEVFALRQQHYDNTLETARNRTPDYLVQVATTEPDISETAIFFLSLLPKQLRPQITWRWRKLIARRAFPEDPIFGPWHDMMRDPVLKPDEWRERGVDSRIIDGLVAANPTTPADIARTYGEMIRGVWARKQTEPEAAASEDDPIGSLLLSRESPVWFPIEDVYHLLSRKEKDAFRGLVNQLDAIAVKHSHAPARAMVMKDSEVLYDPVIFQRGDPGSRGNPVPRQFLRVVSRHDSNPFPNGSGRLDLANAIASADNPLTARVCVNRVWMHHFGEPLVENPGDFGLRTPQPVHHELLDYLAAFLIENGWRTKPLHELIMTSAAYQRASRIPETDRMAGQLQSDPDNRLFWHASRRRLDLEQMRDTMLFVSGRLDDTMFGRPKLITDTKNHRRTVYAFVERQNLPNIIQTFDFANADTSTPRRTNTTVPQQALFAMNSDFMTESANRLAARTTGDNSARIKQLYELTLGRAASDDEMALAAEFLAAGSLQQFAQVLLMSNELIFVD